MLTLLIAASIGAYASQRVSLVRDGEIASMSLDYQRVWNDAIAFFAAIGFICPSADEADRNARSYFDGAIVPWLNSFGISVSLPTLQLPAMPTAQIDA
ncbi:hypothetical protein NIES2135_34270 [Leptolyngbya boryana NIES-2135]|jgi:hypothetical protein|uniref:Uncharacterized protein n=1 Tax=Leptolyngbya boryana NIES-2135 TaxID=1973484 RepID=A0A1Z4JIV8_LEPBY|nr:MULTISPECIES: hypothetical protein [Leptolyngbya]BAY56593.1 hypothetical protein NIES2135_34270 [Leptolyngbya boryana NIES-2135]MBD2369895.1 hypothetical protein [Leptolyngbya sp. FACHB-161]MBD2376160.1 hypothetical protein [Leptolyngbya sp. FACHB-238]MBD2400435.1 hypothetical protein [Leptolyngbya sp. FACHB-239]MBD2406977.1 hypothetical protein [Leptolyngbya sp. FACHB-402]